MCTCACSVLSDSLGPHGLYSLPGSSVRGVFPVLKWGAISSSRGSSNPGIESMAPALAGKFFNTELSRKPLRVHTKCLFGELFWGEARCLGRFDKKAVESCVQPIDASWFHFSPYVCNTVEVSPLTSPQRRERLTGLSMDHSGTAYYCCHYLPLLVNSTAWQLACHLIKWGLTCGQNMANLIFHDLWHGKC